MRKTTRRPKNPKTPASGNHIKAPEAGADFATHPLRDICSHALLQESIDQLPPDGYPKPFVACAPEHNCPDCNVLRRERGFEGRDGR